MDRYELPSECGVKSIENDRKVITISDVKFFEDKILGQGRHGTVTYEGEYGNLRRRVAVKCLLEEQFNIQIEGIRNIFAASFYLNINKVIGIENDKNFVFIAMGLCDYDLRRIVADGRLYAGLLKENGHPSPMFVELMRGIVVGLIELHSLGIIHGELEPSHVLISENTARLSGMGRYIARLSGMGRCRRLDEGKSSLGHNATISGTFGWQSPEQILELPQTTAMDMFNLGCVLYFIFTEGKHPFGDLTERETNVVNNNIVNLSQVEKIQVVKDLVSRLLEFKPEVRPKASEVLAHPLFWDFLKRLQFLSDVSLRTRFKDKKAPFIVEELESKGHVVFRETVEADAFITQMGELMPFHFHFGQVQDLLRFINVMMHKFSGPDIPTDIKKLLGPRPMVGLDDYLGRSFPNLFMVVYDVMRLYCKEEGWFLYYLKPGYMIAP